MSRPDLELVRSKADEVVKRARSDEEFAKQLTENPEATLRTVGLPDWAIGQAAYEIRFPDEEVSGYRYCDYTCDEITCWITSCSFYTGY